MPRRFGVPVYERRSEAADRALPGDADRLGAFQSGPAAVIAPFGDVELIGTATLGYFIFGNFPDLWTWLGAAIIIASGLYIALRERQLRAK